MNFFPCICTELSNSVFDVGCKPQDISRVIAFVRLNRIGKYFHTPQKGFLLCFFPYDFEYCCLPERMFLKVDVEFK